MAKESKKFWQEAGRNLNLDDPMHTGCRIDINLSNHLLCQRPPEGYEVVVHRMRKYKFVEGYAVFIIFKHPNGEYYAAQGLAYDFKPEGSNRPADDNGFYYNPPTVYLRVRKLPDQKEA